MGDELQQLHEPVADRGLERRSLIFQVFHLNPSLAIHRYWILVEFTGGSRRRFEDNCLSRKYIVEWIPLWKRFNIFYDFDVPLVSGKARSAYDQNAMIITINCTFLLRYTRVIVYLMIIGTNRDDRRFVSKKQTVPTRENLFEVWSCQTR